MELLSGVSMDNVAFDFKHFTVLVSGGASGMGAQVAGLFAQAGADVLIVDANAELADQTARALGATVLVGDVSESHFCDEAVAVAVQRTGRLNAVVNAAGIIARKTGVNTTDEEWERAMAVNAGGTFYMSRAAARHMRSHGGGAVVNFGSIWGELAGPGALAYASSKGAVHQVTRTFALELAREGVRFNCVCPGEVDTPMLRAAGRATPLTDQQALEMGQRVVPMGRLAQPQEIARVALFLCSNAASYMTGAMVYVDGGFSTQ
jgi:meso-butanediol dehydrogenase/(S,S)-butanediol dehydrogenase/diacetyl reductase